MTDSTADNDSSSENVDVSSGGSTASIESDANTEARNGQTAAGTTTDGDVLNSHGRSLDTRDDTLTDDTLTILILSEANQNRRLLAEFLEREATVIATSDVHALTDEIDLCLVDRRHLDQHRGALVGQRETIDPVFLPVALVDSETAQLSESDWAVVDEVVRTPISKPILRARVQNLLERRRQSRRLAERERSLESALAELRVRDRAMAEAPIGVTISGPLADDAPLVYVNDAFVDLTGYDRAAALGRNCRFLQGARTSDETRRELRAALEAAEPIGVDIVNYTRDGAQFWNKVDIAPIKDEDGAVTHFIGFQTDITARKLHEQRVDVLNRLMRHNLRNELNIIDGYRDALTSDVDIDPETALTRIGNSINRLVGLSEEASHIEQVFDGRPRDTDITPVSELLDDIRDRVRRRHSGVTVHVEAPDETVHVSAKALTIGCADYLSMLLDTTGNETSDQEATVVATAENGVVDIELVGNGEGLPASEWRIVEDGIETPLRHTDNLGIWMLRWVTTTNGGELVRQRDGTIHVRFPVRDPPASDDAHGSTA